MKQITRILAISLIALPTCCFRLSATESETTDCTGKYGLELAVTSDSSIYPALASDSSVEAAPTTPSANDSRSKAKCIRKLERLTKEVKKDCANYTDEDWDAIMEQYTAINDELKTYELDEEELRQVGKLKGRFLGMVAKKNLSKGSKVLNDFLQQMGGFLEGLMEGTDE